MYKYGSIKFGSALRNINGSNIYDKGKASILLSLQNLYLPIPYA